MKEVYFELSHPESGYFFIFEKIFEKKSKFQNILIANSRDLGKCLILDGVVQFSEKDEFLYHESLVQPAVHLLESPKKVLILGGGDGLAAREFLKHNDIEKVVFVDIDNEVAEVSKKYFPELAQGAFEDPRLEMRTEDAFKYVENTKEKFDVIVMDLTDPGQPIGEVFYSDKFFGMCKKIMTEKSIFVTHGSCFSLAFPTALRVFMDFRKSFKHAKVYRTEFMDSYDTPMGFMVGADYSLELNHERMNERYSKIKEKLKYYSPEIHNKMFVISRWMRRLMEKVEPLPKGYTEVRGSHVFPMDKFPLNKK